MKFITYKIIKEGLCNYLSWLIIGTIDITTDFDLQEKRYGAIEHESDSNISLINNQKSEVIFLSMLSFHY